MAIGALVLQAGKVLLVQRKKEPNKGRWAIPGGAVKLGETLRQAVKREIREETGLIVRIQAPIHVFDFIERDKKGHVRFHYVIVDFMANYVKGTLRPGDDASDARWFSRKDLKDMPISRTTREFLKKIKFLP